MRKAWLCFALLIIVTIIFIIFYLNYYTDVRPTDDPRIRKWNVVESIDESGEVGVEARREFKVTLFKIAMFC